MSKARFHYLDHLRAFAMLFGILLHATTLAAFGSIEIVTVISNNFRMAVFYVLSGFFAGMLIDRKGFSTFLKDRTIAIGLPLLVTLVLLNPITLWLVYNIHNPPVPLDDIGQIVELSIFAPADVSGPVVWHLHLWFLIALLVYILLARPMQMAIKSILSFDGLRRTAIRIPGPLRMSVLALAATIAVMSMRAVSSLTLGEHEAFWIVRATLAYAPWYALGLLCWQERALWERMHKLDPVLISVVVVLWIATGHEDVSGPVYVLRRSLTIVAVLCGLLYVFRQLLDRSIPAIDKITNGAYSIYLFHYAAINLLGTVLIPVFPENSIWLYWIVVTGTFAITYALHRGMILRVPILAFLFNGKLARPAARPK